MQSTTPQAQHFVAHLEYLARHRAEAKALVVLGMHAGQSFERCLSYADLAQRVRALAANLQYRFEPGDRVMIMLGNDEHYVVSLLACFYAGLIAVPAFIPVSTQSQHVGRLQGIAIDAQIKGIVTVSGAHDLVQAVFEGLHIGGIYQPIMMVVDQMDVDRAVDWTPWEPAVSDIAFLQYTSGSTSTPKGVMISHACLMANERAIQEGLCIGPEDNFAVWSPLFHDMGLIGGVLQPLYSGTVCYLSSPQFFLEQPLRWLKMITEYGVSVSGGPDFAYRLCVERVKPSQLRGLDLSSWRVAYTGAEPIRHDTMANFCERFQTVGFDPAAVYPCYGLAEATLFVTGVQRGAGLKTAIFDEKELSRDAVLPAEKGAQLVSCGTVASEHALTIVDPHTGIETGEGHVGEICVSGPSLAKGYWEQPEETAQTWPIRQGQPCLRTGDLGFQWAGQLYVTGRLKDMLIVRGHNVYPQDVERAIEAQVGAARQGRVAVFAVEGSGVGVALEISRGQQKQVSPEDLLAALCVTVSAQCGEAPRVVVLLNPGGLPKTSSGKLQRAACCQDWHQGHLDAYARYADGRWLAPRGGAWQKSEPAQGVDSIRVIDRGPLNEMEQALSSAWREVLRHDETRQYSAHDHFFALGGNSLSAVELLAIISRSWGVDVGLSAVFENPRLGDMAQHVQRMRVTATTGGHSARCVTIPALPPEQRHAPLSLSYAQERQWFLWRMDPLSSAYHIGIVLHLTGTLQPQALQQALAGLVAQHESLRTCFSACPEGQAVQQVQPPGPTDLTWIDLRGTGDDQARASLADAHVQRLHQTPFDLTLAPPIRVALLQLSSSRYRLVMVMHHIIGDGVSVQLMLNELSARYAMQCRGQTEEALALPVQVVDYAAWQRQVLSQGEGERQRLWWAQYLGAEHPILRLPTDHPRGASLCNRVAHHAFGLPQTLLSALRQRALTEGVSLFAVLLAGFQVLLHRLSGQHDIRVGVPVANRTGAQTSALLGLFVNTVIMRNLIHGRLSGAQVVQQAQRARLAAQAHQDLPFEQVVEALQPERSASYPPLCQVMFNFFSEDHTALANWPALQVRHEELAPPMAQFELVLDVRESPEGAFSAAFRYAPSVFEPQTIVRWVEHWEAILSALAEHPQQAVGDVDIMGAAQHRQWLHWGDGNRARPREVTNLPHPSFDGAVHRVFEQQVRAQPEAVALIMGEQSWSREALNQQANQWAHCLMDGGVGRECRVGLLVQRSVSMVVGALAILKAGATFVPLDLELPAERLRRMMKDSGLMGVLTTADGGLQIGSAGLTGMRVWDLETGSLEGCCRQNPGVEVHGEQLAYVMYTSGSTGHPKGAAIRHRALSACLSWMQSTYALTPQDGVMHKAPLGFDVSIWEIFWPLMAGARLVLTAAGDQRDPQRLGALIRKHQVTTVNFVPSMLQAFLAHEAPDGLSSLRYLLCGGEPMPATTQRLALQRWPGVSLENLYGPTETTIHVTRWSCKDDAVEPVPMGRPIWDTQAYVLDADVNPVPQGVVGELFIGGDLLARGYWGRPDLSAACFVANPHGPPGARMYRTGDAVRWNPHGQLDFLGRIDHQVKVRGVRIELGELEAQLRAQSSVLTAVAVAREQAGHTQLVAYVVPQAGHRMDVVALRNRLAEVLPSYMQPAAITVLAQLPLNANGKVDRRALPEPVWRTGRTYEPVQGEVERLLADIWAEVLGVAQVGREDHFFELGGHSLLALRVVALLAQRQACEVPVRYCFEAPVLKDMAMGLSLQYGLVPGAQTTRLSHMHAILSEFEG